MVATATFVSDVSKNFRGHTCHYRLSDPLCGFSDVVVSSANVFGSGPETYIFGAHSNGEVADWLELPGSTRGNASHEEVLASAGYSLSA